MKKLILLSLFITSAALAQFIQNVRQLTFVGPRAGEGYFSADGKKMIFQSERSEGNPFYQMFVLDLEKGKTTRLSPGYGQTTCGWIHPKQNKALWSSTHLDPKWKEVEEKEKTERKSPVKKRYSWAFDSQYEIFESDLQGKNLKRLTKTLGYDAEGSYSPDGKWIAFASNRTGYDGTLVADEKALFEKDPSSQMEIYIMKADGTQVRRLTRSLGYDGGPFFSADGSKITWRRFSPEGSTAEIWTMNVDGSEQRQITRLNKMSWAPFFHPSGDYIIFNSNIEGHSNFELYIVDAKGTKEPQRVTNTDGFDGLATFTPDGTQISWTKRGINGDSQIFIGDWNDLQARQILGLENRAQPNLSFSPQIREKDLKAIVEFLSSADMKGRRTGSGEEKIYTAQIAQLFKSWGLQPAPGQTDYFHEFDFISGIRFGQNNSLSVEGLNVKQSQINQLSQTFEPLSMSKNGLAPMAEVVFAGYGLKTPVTEKGAAYDSYEGLDVKGKWVLIFQDVPQDVSPELRQHYNQFGRTEFKATVAKSEGALGLILVAGPRTQMTETWGVPKLEGSPLDSGLTVIKISRDFAKLIFQKAGLNADSLQKRLDAGEKVTGSEIKGLKLQVQVDLIVDKGIGRNVVGYLPANSKSKSPALILGAHGDHLGLGDQGSSLAKGDEKGQIHYGADDNASGVSSVLELAHYFSKAPTPMKVKQDLFFAIWSGEEMGLLGSKAWIQDWKKTQGDLNKTFTAQINLDMVGRLKEKLIVQGVGSSPVWAPMLEELSIRTGLPVAAIDDPYVPTDSMAFYIEKIPTLSLFTGAHAEYHTPRDQAQLIQYPGLMRVTEFTKQLTQDLSWTKSKISYLDIPQSKRAGGSASRSFRIFLGTIPDYSQEGVRGVRVSGVSKDSPAEKSGLKSEDIIVQLGSQKIENLYDYTYALQALKPGAEIPLKVMRSGQLQELKIVPLLKE
ncbi:MAG: M28 family peptidase [Bdellovibrionales bacterium]